jgi:hypothetical protein
MLSATLAEIEKRGETMNEERGNDDKRGERQNRKYTIIIINGDYFKTTC